MILLLYFNELIQISQLSAIDSYVIRPACLISFNKRMSYFFIIGHKNALFNDRISYCVIVCYLFSVSPDLSGLKI